MSLFDIYKAKKLGADAAKSLFDSLLGKAFKIASENLFDINNLSTASRGTTWVVRGKKLTIIGDGRYNYQSVGYGNASNLTFEPGTYRVKGTIVSNTNTAVYSRIGFRNSSNAFQNTYDLRNMGDFEFTVKITTNCYFGMCVNANEANHAATVVFNDIYVSKEG